jgi:hypothetical protein
MRRLAGPMRRLRPYGGLAAVVLALLAVRAASAIAIAQPGYTDAYYYATVAGRLARGEGLTADFVWNFLEAPQLAALPVASHRFWMPLASLVQAAGIRLIGGPLGDFRAAQLATILVAAAIPLVTYAAARSLGAGRAWALLGAAVAGLGGAFAPAWVSLDSFGIAAVIGTGFFLAYARAAQGSVLGGIASGALVGLLHLARAEGALFGLALLWLLRRRRTRRAGATGTAIALAVGLAWVARNGVLGFPEDLFARAVLLVRYEDFFALEPPTLAAFLGAPVDVLAAKASALVTNALTAAMSLLVVLLVPMAVAVRRHRARPEVVAFAGLVVVVYLTQSLAFTLHSVRGSFFHSVAAFFPMAVALAAAGAGQLFTVSTLGMRRLVAATTVVAFAAVSAFAIAEWDVSFNAPYRARLAVLPLLPPGALVVTDAAAWRWVSGRQAVVAPADGPRSASCAAEIYLAETLILEPAHFSRYAELYASQRSEHFTLRTERDGIRMYAPRRDQRCIIAGGPDPSAPSRAARGAR